MAVFYGKQNKIHTTIKVTPEMVQKVVKRFKGKSSRTDSLICNKEILRMATTASLIPVAESATACIVDVSGTVFWLPIYAELLDYRKIIVLARSGCAWSEYFDRDEIGDGFDFEIYDCDAELSTYPLCDGQASCVVCFDLLEHLAGDPMALVAECNRILKEGGTFCLTTPNVLSWNNLLRFMFGGHPFGWSVFTDSYADRHNREYTPFEVKRMLEAGGFYVSIMKTFTYTHTKSRFRKLVGYLLCLPPDLTKRVKFEMRGSSIGAVGRKSSGVVDRYPAFLYEMYGAKEVQFNVRNY